MNKKSFNNIINKISIITNSFNNTNKILSDILVELDIRFINLSTDNIPSTILQSQITNLNLGSVWTRILGKEWIINEILNYFPSDKLLTVNMNLTNIQTSDIVYLNEKKLDEILLKLQNYFNNNNKLKSEYLTMNIPITQFNGLENIINNKKTSVLNNLTTINKVFTFFDGIKVKNIWIIERNKIIGLDIDVTTLQNYFDNSKKLNDLCLPIIPQIKFSGLIQLLKTIDDDIKTNLVIIGKINLYFNENNKLKLNNIGIINSSKVDGLDGEIINIRWILTDFMANIQQKYIDISGINLEDKLISIKQKIIDNFNIYDKINNFFDNNKKLLLNNISVIPITQVDGLENTTNILQNYFKPNNRLQLQFLPIDILISKVEDTGLTLSDTNANTNKTDINTILLYFENNNNILQLKLSHIGKINQEQISDLWSYLNGMTFTGGKDIQSSQIETLDGKINGLKTDIQAYTAKITTILTYFIDDINKKLKSEYIANIDTGDVVGLFGKLQKLTNYFPLNILNVSNLTEKIPQSYISGLSLNILQLQNDIPAYAGKITTILTYFIDDINKKLKSNKIANIDIGDVNELPIKIQTLIDYFPLNILNISNLTEKIPQSYILGLSSNILQLQNYILTCAGKITTILTYFNSITKKLKSEYISNIDTGNVDGLDGKLQKLTDYFPLNILNVSNLTEKIPQSYILGLSTNILQLQNDILIYAGKITTILSYFDNITNKLKSEYIANIDTSVVFGLDGELQKLTGYFPLNILRENNLTNNIPQSYIVGLESKITTLYTDTKNDIIIGQTNTISTQTDTLRGELNLVSYEKRIQDNKDIMDNYDSRIAAINSVEWFNNKSIIEDFKVSIDKITPYFIIDWTNNIAVKLKNTTNNKYFWIETDLTWTEKKLWFNINGIIPIVLYNDKILTNTNVTIADGKRLKSNNSTLQSIDNSNYVTKYGVDNSGKILNLFKMEMNSLGDDAFHDSSTSKNGYYLNNNDRNYILNKDTEPCITIQSQYRSIILSKNMYFYVEKFQFIQYYNGTLGNGRLIFDWYNGITTSSDIRLKNNINEIICDKNEIYWMFDLMNVKTFNSIEHDDNKMYGLIAQDIEWNTILKECLLTIPEINGYYWLCYSHLSLINTMGIQQLIKEKKSKQIKIDSLESEINNLEKTIQKIKTYLNLP